MANELDFGTGIALIKGLGGKPTDEQVTTAVDAWLDAHPEATTTVEDGAISYQKLDSTLKGKMDDVGNLKTAIDNFGTKGKTEKNVTGTLVKLSEDNVSNVRFHTENEAHVYGLNRIDIANVSVTHDGYASTVITKTDTGISIYYPGGGTFKYAYISYTAEFDGDLWVSCVASTAGNIRDCFMLVQLNGSDCEMCYGQGLLKEKITVAADDVVRLCFCMRAQDDIANTIVYDKIMVSYSNIDFVPYNDYTNKQKEVISHTLPTGTSDYTTSTPATSVSGTNLTLIEKYSGIPVPSHGSLTPSGLIVTGLPLVPYNSVYNGTEGLGIAADGTLMIRVDGLSNKTEYLTWLTNNPVTVSWEGTDYIITPFDGSDRDFVTGESISFASSTAVTYYYKNEVAQAKAKMVCFGDSITGMFAYDTDYPSMISNESAIEAINCGFSGSCWTDYGTGNLMPFSINRLIDAIVNDDYSLQDAAIASVSTALYAEHYAALKAVDWSEVEYVTFLAGTNDWYYGLTKLYSEDDTSTENKQRTNMQDCVPYCITQLLTKYPHLKIVVLTPYHAFMQNKNSDVDANTNGDYLYEYAEVIKQCAESVRVPCVEQYLTSGINQITMYYYTKDGTHPNEPMKHMIAKRILKAANAISGNDVW